MNSLHFTVYEKDLSGSMLVPDAKFEKCAFGTLLHGGFGPFKGSLPVGGYDAYLWYADYHNARVVVQSRSRDVVWEGRVEDVTIVPGYGVEVGGFGYWRNCFDVPMEDTDSWASGTHYPEDIIETVVAACCKQLQHSTVRYESTGRNVAPFKVEGLQYPQAIIKRLLEGGDQWGSPVYFAVWRDRFPYVFVRDTGVDWYVRVEDLAQSPRLTRSMEPSAQAVIVEYSVEGEAGDANEEGTATGERANNYVTLTDTGKGWDKGQWDTGFDVAIVGGTGIGQKRDVLRTRLEPTVSDEGKVEAFDSGTVNPDNFNLPWALKDSDKSWTTDEWIGYRVKITAGTCVGQDREIASNGLSDLVVSEEWEADEDTGYFPNSHVSTSSYIFYKPDEMADADKAWANDLYNDGYVVEIVAGVGAAQRRNITDTKTVTVGGTTYRVLVVEPEWETVPDATSWYEIHQEALVVKAGIATGGSLNTLEDTTRSWAVDAYSDDYELVILVGACAGQTGRIVSNTATVLTVEPLWDNDVPDDTSEWEIRLIQESEDEEAEEGACTQLVVTTRWTTQLDATSEYEIRQKEDGGVLQKTTRHTSGRAIRDLDLCRVKVFSLGTTTPGDAERVAGRLRALLRDPVQRGQTFGIKRVYSKQWVEFPLAHVRAGDVLEIVDLFAGQAEAEALDALRRFFIIRTTYDQARQVLSVTPDTVDTEIATLIASARM